MDKIKIIQKNNLTQGFFNRWWLELTNAPRRVGLKNWITWVEKEYLSDGVLGGADGIIHPEANRYGIEFNAQDFKLYLPSNKPSLIESLLMFLEGLVKFLFLAVIACGVISLIYAIWSNRVDLTLL